MTPTQTGGTPPPSGAPLAVSHSFYTVKNAPKWFILPAAPQSGGTLSYTVLTSPQNGTLSGTAPKLKYAPNNNYTGLDSFTFRVTENGVNSAVAQITLVVQSPSSYTPPIGVPMPAFGITQTVEGVYGSPTYFTHQANGSIPSNVPAGSVVLIPPGTYGGLGVITSQGTSSQPIFYRGSDPNNPPVITSKLAVTGSYIIFENIIVDRGYNSSAVNIVDGAHHVALRHSTIKNGQGEVLIYGGVNNIVVFNNILGQNGANQNPAGDVDDNGVQIGGNSQNTWVLDNLVTELAGSGVVLNASFGSPNTSIQRSFVGRNEVSLARQSGIWSKESMDSVFSQNLVFGLRMVSHTSADGIGYQYGPERLWIINNRLFDMEYGIRNGGDDNSNPGQYTYIIGNVIHDIHKKSGTYDPNNTWTNAGITFPNGIGRYIYNNIIYNSDAGILCTGDGYYEVVNNIVANTTKSGASHFWLRDEAGNTTFSLRNNLFWQAGGNVGLKYHTTMMTLPNFQTNLSSHASGNLQGSIGVVSEATRDFHLTSSSIAIDAGLDLNISAAFQSTFGIPLAVDFDNQSRPFDGNGDGLIKWDIGPYERH